MPFRRIHVFRRPILVAAISMSLVGCEALPTPPQPFARYDLGVFATQTTRANLHSPLRAVALANIQAPLQAEGSTAMHYRLAYADGQQLHAYSQARWSLPPAQLVQQRLYEYLGQNGRVILSVEQGGVAPQVGSRQVPVLRLTLEEFSQVFTDTQHSNGHVRMRASLIEPAPEGDVLLAQQVFFVQVPAKAPDAASGAQALAQAINELGFQITRWLE